MTTPIPAQGAGRIDLPLTCEYCRTAPASCLMVVDFEYSRVKALVCQPCGERSRPDAARVAKAAWLFSLAAISPDPDCPECGFGLPRHDRRCSRSVCRGEPDPLPIDGREYRRRQLARRRKKRRGR